MKEQQLLSWIENQKSNLDQIIFEAGYNFLQKNKTKPNFPFDLSECQSESFNLIGNKDLCYDRYCTPFVYSLWYHARRLNTFLRFFSRAILSSNDRLIEIFDLGAGTGAVQFAAGLVYLGMKELGLNPPKIRIINIDTSPFMLSYNNEFLWQSFLNKYQELKNNSNFTVEYNVNSWNVKTEQQAINPWITASYLFDISDNKEAVTNDFLEIIKHYNPTTVLLLTSNQEAKVKLLNGVLSKIRTQNYIVEEVNETTLLFKGSLDKVNSFRKKLSEIYQGKGLGNSSNWSDNSFVGTILRKNNQSLNLITENSVTNIDLFNPKIKVRKDIKLSEQQKKASQFIGRPSIIVGPAGSGKSVVISEKIKYIVENQSYNPNLKILVTSFNKSLIKKLGEWTGQLLNQNNFTKTMISDEASTFTFSNSKSPNITLMHFDLLPTRLGDIKGTCYDDEQHIKIIQTCIEQVKKDKNINHNRFDTILDAEFIYEEYHRIFYGMHVKSRDEYLSIVRKGMWQPLNKERREIVFDCISLYMNRIFDKNSKTFNPHSFLTRRRILLNNLKSNQLNIKYDYIFVDEFQDCTQADF
ncbi:MAG: UvrD-helicase domain-containing protein, partial [candidate division WOR-3 bacterium]